MLFLLIAFVGGLVCSKWIKINFDTEFEQWRSTQTATVTTFVSGQVAKVLEQFKPTSTSPDQTPVTQTEFPPLAEERALTANADGLE
jgi:hypothetical protein